MSVQGLLNFVFFCLSESCSLGSYITCIAYPIAQPSIVYTIVSQLLGVIFTYLIISFDYRLSGENFVVAHSTDKFSELYCAWEK